MKSVVVDHNVVITGACGDLGGAFARAMHELGAHVYLLGYDKDKLAKVAHACGDAPHFVVDVTKYEALTDIVHSIGQECCDGEIDLLACFAGIAGQSVVGGRADLYASIMRVNYEGTVNTVNAAMPYLERAGGQVVVTSSMAQFFDLPFMGAYGASKAAVGKWARTLRLELRRSGVTVTVLYPNVIDTNMTTKGYVTRVGGIVRKLVPPISLDKAMRTIVNGVLRGKRGVYLPRWMVIVPLFAPVINVVIELALWAPMPRLRDMARQDDGAVELTTVQHNN